MKHPIGTLLWLTAPIRLAACALVPAVAAPHLAGAQRSGGVDAALQSRYVWRGLDRVTRPIAIASGFLAFEQPAWSVSAGGWASFELWEPRTSDATVVGTGASGLAETNLFVQADYYARRDVNFGVGAVQYDFHGSRALGGKGMDMKTVELYGRVATQMQDWENELTWWQDVDRIEGSFVTHVLRRRLHLFPLLVPPSMIASVETGWSVGQDRDERGEGGSAYFEKDGFRYADATLAFQPFWRVGGMRLTLDLALHYTFGRNDAWLPGSDRPIDRAFWAELRMRFPGVSPLERGQ